MSLTRNLVDLYILASGVTKVGSSVIASQSSAVCLHVKTSSLLNPTPIRKERNVQFEGQPQPPIGQAIEVPFPEFVEKKPITKQKLAATNDSVPNVKDTTPSTPSAFTSSPIAETPAKESISRKVEPVNTTHVTDAPPQTVISSALEIESINTQDITNELDQVVAESKRRELKESRIPTSRFGRLWNYGTLATGMGMGAINESFKRATGLSHESSGNKQFI